jgi:hypothetical protein
VTHRVTRSAHVACCAAVLALPAAALVWIGCTSTPDNTPAGVGPVDPGGTFGAEIVVHVTGGGRVVSAPAGIDCPRECHYGFMYDPAGPGAKQGVQLTAQTAQGWRFTGWQLNNVTAKSRGKAAESCQPFARPTSPGPGIDPTAATIALAPGETQGTPATTEIGCAPGPVPVAYDVTATFVRENPVDGGGDGGDAGAPDQLYDTAAAGAVGRKIFVRNSRVYWQWDVVTTGTQSGLSMGFTTGGSRTDLVPLGPQITQFYVGGLVVYQNVTPNLYTQSLTGTNTTLLSAAVTCSAVSADTTYAYCRSAGNLLRWTPQTPLASGLAAGSDLWVDAYGILYSDTSGGAVYQLPVGGVADGGVPADGGTPVAVGQSQPASAVGSSTLYAIWITNEGGGVNSLKITSRAGGGPVTVLDAQIGIKDFATDGAFVYYTVVPSNARGASSIRRISVGGGTPVPLRSGLYDVGGIATDGAFVYWTDGDGRVFRAPRS